MRACKCPNCGANLSFDDTSRDYAFCEYCGAKIDLMDKRTYHTEHIIDEAKIKNAENISRIVNIFAAPVEEKQRQKEFERQQQAEAARREYERQKRKDEEARENREAMEDGCAAAMSGCLVKCAKHPIIALVIAIAMLGSCMGSDSSSSSSSSSTSSKSQSTTISASMTTIECLTARVISSGGAPRSVMSVIRFEMMPISFCFSSFFIRRTPFGLPSGTA